MKLFSSFIIATSICFFITDSTVAQISSEFKSIDDAYVTLNSGAKDSINSARKMFLTQLKSRKLRSRAIEGLAWTEVKAGNFEKASWYADLGKKENPTSLFWKLKNLEIKRVDQRNKEEIRTAYEKLLQSEPKRIDVLEQYTDWLMWDEQTRPTAISLYEQGIKRAPNNQELRLKYARALLVTKNFAKAILVFKDIDQKKPSPASRLGLVQCYHWSGEFQLASDLLKIGLTKYPNDPELLTEQQALARNYKGDISAWFRIIGFSVMGERFVESSGYARNSILLSSQWIHKVRDHGNLFLANDSISLNGFNDGRKKIAFDWTHEFHKIWNLKIASSVSKFTTKDPHLSYEITNFLGASNRSWQLRLGYRQDLLIDSPTDLQSEPHINSNGSAGASIEFLQNGFGVKEGFFNGGIGSDYGYIWTNLQYGQLTDRNQREILATGLALNILKLAQIQTRQVLYFTFNAFTFGTSVQTPDYFSPARFSGVFPGATWIMSPVSGFNLRAEFSYGFLFQPPNKYNALSAGGSLHYTTGNDWDFYLRFKRGRDVFYNVQLFTLAAKWIF